MGAVGLKRLAGKAGGAPIGNRRAIADRAQGVRAEEKRIHEAGFRSGAFGVFQIFNADGEVG